MESFSLDLVTLIQSASGLAKGVLFLLFALSVITWGIIIEKGWVFWRSKKARKQFGDYQWNSFDPEDLRRRLNRTPQASVTRVFHKVYQDYFATHRLEGDEDALARLLQKQGAAEIARLESRLGILASVGSACPFIGLFGTVWGVMRSFLNIGTWGSTSLAVVAPGIAEALIATAAGLAAAIPAVVAYNFYLGMLRTESRALEDFSTDLLLAVRSRKPQNSSASP
ncbi:MAG: MotA/TolQ/ExbB proton channel family protein [bacterium]|nr:MotA/TolQ/ExbB proton channel family protein [bacterium]